MATQAQVSAPLTARWRYALRTCGCPPGDVDAVTRWLVITRVCVQPMTVISAAIGGLLAARVDGAHAWMWALAALGLVVAHAANNMINDYFDLESGLDTADYPRALYAPHPVMTGLITQKRLLAAILVANLIDGAIMVTLALQRGLPVVWFALGGLVISGGYVAPPLRLKGRGLGEIGVLIVWGPLMIGGTYYSTTGTIPAEIIWASLPYGLLVMSVLMGKHIDKAPWDEPRGFRTLPVRLGEERARQLTIGLMGAFYAAVGIEIAVGILPVWTAAVVLGLPLFLSARKAYSEPKPAEPPPDYPVWPLWFVSWAFVHSRRAGALLVLGLVLGALRSL